MEVASVFQLVLSDVGNELSSLTPFSPSLDYDKRLWASNLTSSLSFLTKMGFEPTRAMHNGLAVHHLNHSVTSSDYFHHVEVLSPNALADDFNNIQI
ncbi:hypothetical protein OUZ56_024443 [Daphnia magna]|uniref:Uncharacterized protein n=1 Tax=Daphnia magna TaxID=35525 RepID=A0ABR0B0U4_9CRUS|nr:hypothetical protein OUZ56_024443 [Daphnia magna]